MAERAYQLPGIDDLSKAQEDARDLPDDGQHLIIGGPGTGKTVVALLRTRRLASAGIPYVYLVYNKLLLTACKQLFNGALNSYQWQSWFITTYKRYCSEDHVPWTGSSRLDFDWPAIEQKIAAAPPQPASPLHLIIDEGQDLPPEFYLALAAMGFEHFYVVADQNQQIVPQKNSARRDIENALAIDPSETVELTENYRNTHPIAMLARSFYTGDPASPPPVLPDVAASGSSPFLFDYAEPQFDRIINRILIRYSNFPRELICIIAPDNRVREKYFERLQLILSAAAPVSGGAQLPLMTYYHKPNGPALAGLQFDRGGIVVINAQSCKGLEFDFVFLADINHHQYRETDVDSCKRLFYVMVARAISRVVLLREKSLPCPVNPILPTDPTVLERK